jgi:Zn-dependent protease with chaperone function
VNSAGGNTIGERAHVNRRRTAVLTFFLATALVIGAATLTIPFIVLAGLFTGRSLLDFAPAFLSCGAVIGGLVVLWVLRAERRFQSERIERPDITRVSDDSGPAQSLSQVSRGAGLASPPPLYLQEAEQANAYAVGRGPRTAYVVVTSALVRMLEPRELTGVLAHEVAHIVNEDVRLHGRVDTLARVVEQLRKVLLWPTGGLTYFGAARKLVPLAVVTVLSLIDISALQHLNTSPASGTLNAGRLIEGLALVAGGLVLIVAYAAALVYAGRSLLFLVILVYAGLLLPFGLLISNPLLAAVAAARVSRIREYQADADGASYTDDPLALSLALRKFAAIPVPEIIATLAGVRAALFSVPDISGGLGGLISRARSTHPPTTKRIEALDQLAGINTSLAIKGSQLLTSTKALT